MKGKKQEQEDAVTVFKIEKKSVRCKILGLSPLYFNAMSEKTRQTLLLPSPKKTTAEKNVTAKHDMLREYRDSVYKFVNDEQQTLLYLKPEMFKGAIACAAIDLPGNAKKAQIGRLLSVEGTHVPVYGIPQMKCDVVKQAGIQGAPDIRTRAYLTEWACEVVITFVSPILATNTVMTLLCGAGLTQGIGDFRIQKGKGNYGAYAVVDETDKEQLASWQRVVSLGGRDVQDLALKTPTMADDETGKLYDWFCEQASKRDLHVAA